MILRIAIFISLIATFYYYCNDDSQASQMRGPNDLNKIEVPEEISPTFQSFPTANVNVERDSAELGYGEYTTSKYPTIYLFSSLPKN